MIVSEQREVDAHSGPKREHYRVISVLVYSPMCFDYEEHPLMISCGGKLQYIHDKLKDLSEEARTVYITDLMDSHQKVAFLSYTLEEAEFFSEKYFLELI
jgi:hypothetical protein